MKTKVTDTSLIAWDKIQPKLTRKQADVMACIRHLKFPVCSYTIGTCLGWPINRVTGRVTELRDLGLIRDVGMRKSPTGFQAHYYEPTIR